MSLMMNRFLLLVLLACCFGTRVAKAEESAKPNIVFIMADDLGWGDLSCYGHPSIKTPNIDKLAAGGIRFTQAYAASPLCTPSRTAIMTGRYPARTPVGLAEPIDFGDLTHGLSSDTPSLPSLLKRQGYKTCLLGKWHLGYQESCWPNANGFDEFFGYLGGGIDYVAHNDPLGDHDFFLNDRPTVQKGYVTDLIGNYAVNFLKRKHRDPFFLSVQFSAPHWPWQAPGAAPYPLGDKQAKEGGSEEIYRQMVESLDKNIGRILDVLQQRNLESNTLVVFTSDNGGERFSNMGELRGRKFTLWEGGIRVPAIMYWPGRVPENVVSKQPIIHMDWTATFLALAGAEPDEKFPLDGVNIMPLLAKPDPITTRTFFWRVSQRNQQQAVRDGDWKYLKTEEDEYLFNLDVDPSEANDLKQTETEKLVELKLKFESWSTQVLQPLSSAK